LTRNLALLAAGLLAAALLASFSPAVGDVASRAALGAISALGLIALYFADRRREARAAKEARRHAEERFHALQAAWRATQLEIRIDAASQIVASLLTLLFGAMLLLAGLSMSEWIGAAAGAVALLAGIVMLTRSIPALGKPKLVLGRAGFSTPLTPLLSWQLVQGIDLLEIRARDGEVVSHSLIFYIPSLADHLHGFGLFHRLLYRLRGASRKQRLQIFLRNPSEPAEAVLRIAMQLWTEATGRTNAGNFAAILEHAYPAHRAAAERAVATDPKIAALRRDTEAALDGAEKHEALDYLAELEATTRRHDVFTAAQSAAARVRRRRGRYGAVVCLVGALVLLYFGADWRAVAAVAAFGALCLYIGFFESEALMPLDAFIATHPAANPEATEAAIFRAYGRKPPR
jgi:hypothetical protein